MTGKFRLLFAGIPICAILTAQPLLAQTRAGDALPASQAGMSEGPRPKQTNTRCVEGSGQSEANEAREAGKPSSESNGEAVPCAAAKPGFFSPGLLVSMMAMTGYLAAEFFDDDNRKTAGGGRVTPDPQGGTDSPG